MLESLSAPVAGVQECVSRLQRADCPTYGSGAEASYTLKMMTVKVAHKDWTAIDRQLIVSKAKAVRGVMLGVVHHGCEAALKPDGSTAGSLALLFSGAHSAAIGTRMPAFLPVMHHGCFTSLDHSTAH